MPKKINISCQCVLAYRYILCTASLAWHGMARCMPCRTVLAGFRHNPMPDTSILDSKVLSLILGRNYPTLESNLAE